MKITKNQVIGAAACSVMLVGTGAAVAAPAIVASAQQSVDVAQVCKNFDSIVVNIASVEGSFGFTQDAITPVEKIREAFVKSAARLCAVTPAAVEAAGQATVSTDDTFMTLAEATKATEEGTFVLACACSSNLAGGNIVANAEVKGVPVAQIVAGL